MFKENLLRGKIAENGITMKELATAAKMDISTLSRKMSGKSDFTRNDIQLISAALKLSIEDVSNIFFAA